MFLFVFTYPVLLMCVKVMNGDTVRLFRGRGSVLISSFNKISLPTFMRCTLSRYIIKPLHRHPRHKDYMGNNIPQSPPLTPLTSTRIGSRRRVTGHVSPTEHGRLSNRNGPINPHPVTVSRSI